MKKKIMSLLLTVCLVAAMVLPAMAAEDVTAFGGSAVRQDDTVTVTLTVDHAGATSGQLTLSYDADALTLVSAAFGDAVSAVLTDEDDHADSINTQETGTVTAGFASLTASEAGDVLVAVFTAQAETPAEGYTFDYTVDEWSQGTQNDLLDDATNADGSITLNADGSSEVSVDKTALQAAYDEASELTESDYTAESWADLADAMAKAEAVLADEDATQDEVDAALAELLAAIDALEAAQTDTGDTGDSGSTGDSDSTGDSGSTGDADSSGDTSDTSNAKTGDNAPIYAVVAVLIVAAAAIVVLVLLKKRQSR